MPTIHLERVAKVYKSKGQRNAAILNVDLKIEQGSFIFVVGSRGSGKTTLLNLIAGEVEPDRGAVFYNDENILKMLRPGRAGKRLRSMVSMVHQEPRLIRTDTVFDNLVTYRSPLDFLRNRWVTEPRAYKALALVGMAGSEERRVADFRYSACRRIELAKAILNSPNILLLDELTARVDGDTSWDMMQLLAELNKHGTTIVMATHDRQTVNLMRKRVITLSDGRIVGDVPRGRFGDIV